MSGLKVAIVGGGQAGLAMGHALASRGLVGGEDFVILDAADRAGATWASRWDSLRLFTPARFSALPGMAFPGPPDAYPGKDDVAAYLTAYAAHFDLPRPAPHSRAAPQPGRQRRLRARHRPRCRRG